MEKTTVIDVIKVLIRDNGIVQSDLFVPEYIPVKFGGEFNVTLPNIKPFKNHYLGVVQRPQNTANPLNTLIPALTHVQIITDRPIYADTKYVLCEKVS